MPEHGSIPPVHLFQRASAFEQSFHERCPATPSGPVQWRRPAVNSIARIGPVFQQKKRNILAAEHARPHESALQL
jgi:hypothetical protein